jgi:hypothetical protein
MGSCGLDSWKSAAAIHVAGLLVGWAGGNETMNPQVTVFWQSSYLYSSL